MGTDVGEEFSGLRKELFRFFGFKFTGQFVIGVLTALEQHLNQFAVLAGNKAGFDKMQVKESMRTRMRFRENIFFGQ